MRQRALVPAPDPTAPAAPLDFAEVYVACACADGSAHAIAALEARYFPGVDARLAQMSLPADVRADVRQAVREKLFVPPGPDEPPRICRYAGRGRMASLLRAVAFREAISFLRRNRPERACSDDMLEIPSAAADPYLAHSRAQHGAAFRKAFGEAVAALAPRERTILRLRFLDGLSVGEIAQLYGVHRVSASRWFTSARHSVQVGTQRRLRARLDMSDSQLDAFMEHVETELTLSLERLLRSQPEPAEGEASVAGGS